MIKVINYVDLCCGIGGFRIGINNFKTDNYQFNCVASVDIKDDAIKTYNLNFNENIVKTDIFNITELPNFDLLCAGFPCQSFSTAGNKQGLKDKRGTIIFKIIKLCDKYKPNYILLENVYNLIELDNGKIIKKIVDDFEKIGYKMSYKKFNSKDFGVPQCRERVFIVGCLTSKINLDNIKDVSNVTLNDVIEYDQKYTDIDQDFADKILDIHKKTPVYGYKLQDKRGGRNNIHSWDIGYNGIINNDEKLLMNLIMTERRKKHWAIKKKIKWMDGMPLTLEEIKTFYENPNLEKMLDNLVSKKYLKLEKPKDLVNGVRKYKNEGELGYNICKGKLSFPISKILDPHDICPTLTATDSEKLCVIIDNKYIRKLTNNELKSICGFPKDYKITDDVDKYDLFGNMVTPPVITRILKEIF